MNVQDFLTCLGQTETDDTDIVTIGGKHYVLSGDDGRARGRWQFHPDAIFTLCHQFGMQPLLNERWDDFERRLITAFFNRHSDTLTDVQVAMYFHIGHKTVETDADWDKGYAERFQTFAATYAQPR